MKGEDLFIAIGKIDDQFIDGAISDKIKFYKKDAFKRLMAVAACLCILITGYCVSGLIKSGKPPKIENYSIDFGDMGYEGTDELSMKNSDNINPWNEAVILDTLPVYKNLCYNDGKLSQIYYSVFDLKTMAEDLANKLNIESYNTQINESDNDEVYSVNLLTEMGNIIAFSKSTNIITTKTNMDLVAKHREITNGKSNTAELQTGEYNNYSVDGELIARQTRSYYLGDTIEESIINFNFRSHYLSKTENYISSESEDYLKATEKLGDYPIITLTKAKEKLMAGGYITSADEENIVGGKITEAVIVKTDLIYYITGNQQFYLPYYRFYIDYYTGSDFRQYAYFYVCAIEEEYLGDCEVFDGNFQ